VNMSELSITRRNFVLTASAVGLAQMRPVSAQRAQETRSVAAIVTVYRHNSHADVIVGKILDGWKHDGGAGPALRLASLYVDQFPDGDMARKKSAEHGIPIYDTIEQAITLGTGKVAVDGVLSIGEHGDYPWNDKEQHLYPRRRFFDEIVATLEKYHRIVPIFNDKHLGPVWSDAKSMYDQAQRLEIPFMAGSSLPISFRTPSVTLPWKSRVESCVAVGYSGLDVYGFHTLDFMQSILERRDGAETGVRSVQCLTGDSLAQLIQDGTVNRELFGRALSASKTSLKAVLEKPLADRSVFLVQYKDGLLVPVVMLSGIAQAISVAFQVPGSPPVAVQAEERHEPRFPHFANLLKGVEQMIHTNRPAYPVERTLLTSGILDRALTSRARGGVQLATPELEIGYTPVDYPFAPHIDLDQRF
jgi:hypothetical protein